MEHEATDAHQEFIERMEDIYRWACNHDDIGPLSAVAGVSMYADKKREELAEVTGIEKEKIDEAASDELD